MSELNLSKRPQALLVGSGDKPRVREEGPAIRKHLEPWLDVVLQDFDFDSDWESVDAELAVVLGGDGSILRSVRKMGDRQLPILGVNLGKLGFLAAHAPDSLAEVMAEIVGGRARVVEHLMFQCTVYRDGQLLHSQLGLNEVAILGGPPYSMLDVDLFVDSVLATTYSCDGLIVSTPVGSTAHSLSAGGPILRKNLQAFVILPISPHTLTVRPVVDAADRIYEIQVREPLEATAVVVDGRVLANLESSDRVRVERAAACFRLVEMGDQNYYRTLREKLGWAGNIRHG